MWRAIQRCLRLLDRRDRRRLIAVAVAQMSTSILDLLGVLLIGLVATLSVSVMGGQGLPPRVESLLAETNLADIDPLRLTVYVGLAAALALITKSLVNVILTRRVLRFLANRQAIVSGRLAARLLNLPLLEVRKRSSQDTVYALTSGVAAATLIILGQGVIALSEAALLTALFVGLLLLDPLLTLFTVVYFFGISLILYRLLSGWASRLGTAATNAEVESISLVQEPLQAYREITVSQRRGHYVTRFQNVRWQAATVQADLQFMGLMPKYIFEVALVVGAGLLAVSQLVTKDLTAAVGTIAIFLAAGSRVLPSILRLQGAAISIRTAASMAVPTLDLADELARDGLGDVFPSSPSAAVIAQGVRSAHRGFNPGVRVEGVEVTFPGAEAPVLTDVSAHVTAGESLAIVGPTGAGKSTLTDVILGVIQPDRGTVTVGGLTPTEAAEKWPGAIAYVPQEITVVKGTMRENVALGLPAAEIDDDLVVDALKRAHLWHLFEGEREGLNTQVGEHGHRMSGGQRQRLGIARALYSRPTLLILDEATSALDSSTERDIAQTLADLEGSVTTITVAHRLATIKACDCVLYLEGGRVIARGTFDEVVAANEAFARQARLQGL